MKVANLDFLDEGENIENFEPDKETGRIRVNWDQRAGRVKYAEWCFI